MTASAATTERRRSGKGSVSATLALGFRPFYLAGSAFAALAIPLSMLQFQGLLVLDGYLTGAAWHVHEMLFGFVPAIMAGFLFTAVRAWTGLPTPSGLPLAGFLLLWLAGRVLIATGPAALAVPVDLAFLPALAVVLALRIWQSAARRNLVVVLLVALMAAGNLLFHLGEKDLAGDLAGPEAAVVALDVMALLMAMIGGRAIPAFIANAAPDVRPRRRAWLELLGFASLAALLCADALSLWGLVGSGWLAALCALVAVTQAMRLCLWSPFATRREPLLWSLPLAYAWIPAAFALRACDLTLDGVLPALGLHALTLGAMAGLMLALMTRSALGHTGRSLRAGAAETAAYLLIHAAALLRVVLPLLWPQAYEAALISSSLLWSAAFLIFLVRYWPILTRPRADGLPG